MPSCRSPSLASTHTFQSKGLLPGGCVGVEQPAYPPLGQRHPDAVGDALARGSGRRLDTDGVPVLGVAGRQAAPGAQRLQVGQLEAVAAQEQLQVQREARVPHGEHEPVASDPVGSLGSCRRWRWNSR